MSEEIKIDYQPSEQRRFDVSPDLYSRERVQMMKHILEELRKELPDISIAISLFGSLTKGKKLTKETAPSADIDCVVFVDIDDIEKKYEQLLQVNPVFAEQYRRAFNEERNQHARSMEAIKMGETISPFDTELIRNIPKTAAWFSIQRFTKGFFAIKLNEAASRMGFEEPSFTSQKKDIFVWPIALHGDHSIMKAVFNLETAQHYGEESEIRGGEQALSRYFHLNVGGGLRKYRQAFLQELSQMDPEKAEGMWRCVREAVETVERRGSISENLYAQFPQTFFEARRYYGLRS